MTAVPGAAKILLFPLVFVLQSGKLPGLL